MQMVKRWLECINFYAQMVSLEHQDAQIQRNYLSMAFSMYQIHEFSQNLGQFVLYISTEAFLAEAL